MFARRRKWAQSSPTWKRVAVWVRQAFGQVGNLQFDRGQNERGACRGQVAEDCRKSRRGKGGQVPLQISESCTSESSRKWSYFMWCCGWMQTFNECFSIQLEIGLIKAADIGSYRLIDYFIIDQECDVNCIRVVKVISYLEFINRTLHKPIGVFWNISIYWGIRTSTMIFQFSKY